MKKNSNSILLMVSGCKSLLFPYKPNAKRYGNKHCGGIGKPDASRLSYSCRSHLLVVLFVNLKVGLGMCTHGAHSGSLGADYDVSAIAAFPHLDF